MPFTVKTLADLKQSIADRHEAGTLPTDSSTLAYWVRLLNRAKDYCADRLKLTTSTSLTTVSGVIALPDNFMQIVDVVDGNEIHWVPVAKENSSTAAGQFFWITGDQDSRFSLNIPTDFSDTTFTVYYAFRPADMSADADECVIPDTEAVVARAYGMLRMAEFDPAEDADKALGECDRRLDEIVSQRNSNDGGQDFKLYANA